MKKLPLLITILLLSMVGFAQEKTTGVKADFLGMLDGTEEAAQRALESFCSEDVIANGMIPFGSGLVITSTEDNCVWFNLTWEDEVNEYYICSEGDKITEFDWDWEELDDVEEE